MRCGCSGGTAGHRWSVTACAPVLPSASIVRTLTGTHALSSPKCVARENACGGAFFFFTPKSQNVTSSGGKKEANRSSAPGEEGMDFYLLRLKVTLQTLGFGLLSPWSCHHWLTLLHKNSPSIFLVFNHSIQCIPSSFQTVFVTLSNAQLLQDARSLKVNISCRAVLCSLYSLAYPQTWFLNFLFARFSGYSYIHPGLTALVLWSYPRAACSAWTVGSSLIELCSQLTHWLEEVIEEVRKTSDCFLALSGSIKAISAY